MSCWNGNGATSAIRIGIGILRQHIKDVLVSLFGRGPFLKILGKDRHIILPVPGRSQNPTVRKLVFRTVNTTMTHFVISRQTSNHVRGLKDPLHSLVSHDILSVGVSDHQQGSCRRRISFRFPKPFKMFPGSTIRRRKLNFVVQCQLKIGQKSNEESGETHQ